MTIDGACRPPTRDYAGGWHAAGGLLSTLLVRAFRINPPRWSPDHRPRTRCPPA